MDLMVAKKHSLQEGFSVFQYEKLVSEEGAFRFQRAWIVNESSIVYL